MRNNEQGSAHAIIIGIIVIVLIGVVGFFFWQNVLNKPADSVANQQQQSSKSAQKQTGKYCTPVEKLCFDYPTDWSYDITQSDPSKDGVAEEVIISDHNAKKWLKLTTGMGGVGGTCDPAPGSLAKITSTYTTKIDGDYLIAPGTESYVVSTVYAVAALLYDATSKGWEARMMLNQSKAATDPGQIGYCDLGIAIFPGKNVAIKADGDTVGHGAISFSAAISEELSKVYKSEAEATEALETSEAQKAYDILRSARYE